MKLHLPSFLRRILFENSDNPLAPNFKRRFLFNNYYIILSLVSLLGIGLIAMIPVMMFLITVPYFIISSIAGITVANVLLYVLQKHYQ